MSRMAGGGLVWSRDRMDRLLLCSVRSGQLWHETALQEVPPHTPARQPSVIMLCVII